MWEVFYTVSENVFMSFENIILIVFLLGMIIWFYADFKVGVVVTFLLSGAIFMWFYAAGLQWDKILMVFIASFIIMALSLYTISKTAHKGGIV